MPAWRAMSRRDVRGGALGRSSAPRDPGVALVFAKAKLSASVCNARVARARASFGRRRRRGGWRKKRALVCYGLSRVVCEC